MEPHVQYAKTNDGVSIAFASMGKGPPLVRVAVPGFNHVQRDLEMYPGIFQRQTQIFRLVWYDPRGSGLSDREVTDFSMEAMMRDLEAVITRTGVQSFALAGAGGSVPIAVTYAATYPDRVTHLILINGWSKSSDWTDMPAYEAHQALLDSDWTLFTETMVRVLMGIDDPRIITTFGEYIRSCIEPETYRALVATSKSYDVSALLGRVRAETLVLHNSKNRMFPVRAGQRLAAGIPDARFLIIDDLNLERVAALVEEFAGPSAKPAAAEPGAFRTVLFTDLVGHTQMMARLGDERGRELLREHERITREVLRAHGGTEVKTMGDGFLASFGSVTKAVECAVALQREIGNWRSEIGERIEVRCGLNAGEPIAEDGDLFGTTVILASRIAAKAEGGEILVADTVRGLCSGKGFLFSDRGEFVAKGFEEPVRVYEVRWREAE